MKTVSLWSRCAVAAFCALTLITLPGCVAVPPGPAGSVVYVHGDLHATLAGQSELVQHATSVALGKLRFMKLSETNDALVGVYQARTAEDREVKIKVSPAGENLAEVKIRVGFFGNETLSRTILEHIKAEL